LIQKTIVNHIDSNQTKQLSHRLHGQRKWKQNTQKGNGSLTVRIVLFSKNEDFDIKDCELCPFQYDNIGELNANAKLIAAAPELLAALEVCYASLCTYGNHPIIEKQVESAINKATL